MNRFRLAQHASGSENQPSGFCGHILVRKEPAVIEAVQPRAREQGRGSLRQPLQNPLGSSDTTESQDFSTPTLQHEARVHQTSDCIEPDVSCTARKSSLHRRAFEWILLLAMAAFRGSRANRSRLPPARRPAHRGIVSQERQCATQTVDEKQGGDRALVGYGANPSHRPYRSSPSLASTSRRQLGREDIDFLNLRRLGK